MMSEYKFIALVLFICAAIWSAQKGYNDALFAIASALFFIAHEIKQKRGDA